MPSFAVASIFSFIFSWNEFVLPVVISNLPNSTLFQVASYQFISSYRIKWRYLSSGIIVALLPVIILIIVFKTNDQRIYVGSIRAEENHVHSLYEEVFFRYNLFNFTIHNMLDRLIL